MINKKHIENAKSITMFKNVHAAAECRNIIIIINKNKNNNDSDDNE